MQDAQRYRHEENIPWTVVVDDLEGTTHQVYGGLADPTYLIDADGRVAFYNLWTHAPTLHDAIDALLEQGGCGTVKRGVDPLPHLMASITDGWRGLRRGLPQSFFDLEAAVPGVARGTWIGYQLRPFISPITLRAKPLPPSVKIGLVAAIGLILISAQAVSSRSKRLTERDVAAK